MPRSDVSAAGWLRKGALFVDPRLTADGLAHGVTTRALGSMKAPEARTAALREAGLSGVPLYFAKQVHGTTVIRVDSTTSADVHPEADGFVTDLGNVVLSVFMADCTPLFVWKPNGPFGVFHSGWKGTALGMPKAAVKAFEQYGVKPSELKASLGAHIGPCCYRVREDVSSQFPASSLQRKGEDTYLDIGGDAVRQLSEAGLPPGAVLDAGQCTCTMTEDFFSFRRDKAGNSLWAFAGRPVGRP